MGQYGVQTARAQCGKKRKCSSRGKCEGTCIGANNTAINSLSIPERVIPLVKKGNLERKNKNSKHLSGTGGGSNENLAWFLTLPL